MTALIDYESQIQYWANRVSFLLRKEARERFVAEGLDIRAEEMAILMQLWTEPGQTPSMLADKTVRDRTTVTRFLDGMEKKGLIRREPDAGDRRRVIVTATEKSVAMQGRIMPVVRGLIADSMQGVDAGDAAIACDVLRRLAGNLLDMRGEANGTGPGRN